MSANVADHWQDDFIRLNWRKTPELTETAFGFGVIGVHDYLDATRERFRDGLDRLLVDSVAATLTVGEALSVIHSRERVVLREAA